jgi:hypothetical protein
MFGVEFLLRGGGEQGHAFAVAVSPFFKSVSSKVVVVQQVGVLPVANAIYGVFIIRHYRVAGRTFSVYNPSIAEALDLLLSKTAA